MYNKEQQCLIPVLLQKQFKNKSASIHQNKNVEQRILDRSFEGETDSWLERHTPAVIAALLEDVQE
jgi:hypothetical protein